jgi:hypothetical protein
LFWTFFQPVAAKEEAGSRIKSGMTLVVERQDAHTPALHISLFACSIAPFGL